MAGCSVASHAKVPPYWGRRLRLKTLPKWGEKAHVNRGENDVNRRIQEALRRKDLRPEVITGASQNAPEAQIYFFSTWGNFLRALRESGCDKFYNFQGILRIFSAR
uniref:Uncharacterized protein n=1 Tax=Lutzomyia longipalpis TaxID=7200 RepID=A0A1B0CQM9_LUTLO